MITSLRKFLWTLILLGYTSISLSDDIDMFAGVAPPSTADVPNVLFVIDNTANWSSAFINEMAALRTVLTDIEVDKFKFGFMMFSESGGANGNPGGAYVRAGLRLMDATNKQLYLDLVNSFDTNADKASGGKLGVSMAEAYYYFSASEAFAGHNKEKRDHVGNVSGTAASNAVYALPGNAFVSDAATQYENPIDSPCQKNFIIYISNGAVQDNTSDIATANDLLTALGGDTSEISVSPNGSQSIPSDEWARYMATVSPHTIKTYTIDVDPVTTGQGPGFTALLKSMAAYGKGKYFSVDSTVSSGTEISVAIKKILSEINSVNSVFASASLPVSVNTQGTFLNQIFIGMFRPDISADPRWNGNLKQYKFKASLSGDGFVLNLVDADEQLAINRDTGFVTQCARSFWTPAIIDTYWSFQPEGSCLAVTNSDISNSPDGDIVEKGAAGYVLRQIDPLSRVVKTCDPGVCFGLTDFNDANIAITRTDLNVVNAVKRTEIINWARGMDVKDENSNSIFTDMRPSAHGDVVHSRPVAIDYGVGTGVVVFYGAGDGFLHAINGNQADSIGAIPPGGELWSFIAPEHYGKLKRIFDNTPAITFPITNDGTAKPYFFDGPITAHKDTGSSATWLYASQRRGGRMIYAFDVSVPTNPILKWRHGCPNLTDDIGCTGPQFIDMGQTWSATKIVKTSGYGSTKPLLLFGGGYDTCEDGDVNTCTVTPKGNKVFVMDADTGAVLNRFTTDRSVVGDITVVPNKVTGLADYAYAVDTGGNIYRITIGSSHPSSWAFLKIASLGCDTVSCPPGIPNRKFLFAPEVVVTPDFNVILVGSGDREHPLLAHGSTANVDNAFFMVKDNPVDSAWWSLEAANCSGATLACMNSLLSIDPDSTVVPTEAQLAAKKGWYLAFGSGGHDKEQVVTSAVAVLGTVTFSTHTPMPDDPSACGSNLGLARVYNLGFLDSRPIGGSRFAVITGGGLPPSPVAGMVTVLNPKTGQNITVPFVIGANPDSPLEGRSPRPAATSANFKTRAYWYLQQ